ncbi:hypothetical protein ECN1_3047 [Escherichia coli N1]|nr:hypothetical protein ECN1_3047 [Escherichia coli N1]
MPELRWLQRSHFCAIVSTISTTPKGQAIAHLLQPIHFCSSSCTLSDWKVRALTGQAVTQGALLQ